MIINYKIENQEVIDFINKRTEHGEELNSILDSIFDVGVNVLQRVQASRDVDFVKKETQKLLNSFETNINNLEKEINENVKSHIDDKFNPEMESSYSFKFAKYLRDNLTTFKNDISPLIAEVKNESELLIKTSKDITKEKIEKIETQISDAEKNFNPDLETSYFGRIKKIINDLNNQLNQQLNDQQIGSFAHKLKDDSTRLFGENSPIVEKISSIIDSKTKIFKEEIINLREDLAKEQGKIEGINETFQKTAIKGRSFENELLIYLEDIAKPLNDIVEFTGDFAEDGTLSKKGDFIYTLNSGQSILIEAKDRELGLKPAIDYLKAGMEKRGKKFSILTFKYENQLPRSVDLIGFYENNKVLTSKEYLKFALQWARIFLNKSEDKLAEGINETLVLQKVSAITNKLKSISTLKTKLTNLRNNVSSNSDSIEVIIDELKNDIIASLNEIENEFIKNQKNDSNDDETFFDLLSNEDNENNNFNDSTRMVAKPYNQNNAF